MSALAHRRATVGTPSTPTTGAVPPVRSPLVLLHGFTQSSRCWAPIDEALAEDHGVVTVDLPGHGGSNTVRADLWGTADLVAATLAEIVEGPAPGEHPGSTTRPTSTTVGSSEGPGPERGAGPAVATGTEAATGPEGAPGPGPGPEGEGEGGSDGAGPRGRVTLVGYSMGGRVALHVALAHPALVGRLVLVGATPGIEDDDERAARRLADEALADRIEAIGVPAFLDEWLALPLFAGLTPDAAHRAEREANTAAGLASSLRLTGTGTQAPLWDRLGELTMPTLLVTGEHDRKFTEVAQRMLPLLGGPAEHVVVPDAGHTAHLEQPEAFLDRLRPWLTATT